MKKSVALLLSLLSTVSVALAMDRDLPEGGHLHSRQSPEARTDGQDESLFPRPAAQSGEAIEQFEQYAERLMPPGITEEQQASIRESLRSLDSQDLAERMFVIGSHLPI